MKAIGTNRAPGMLLCPSLICVSQKKTTIFRLVKVTGLDRPTGQKLLESLICTSLKIVTFVWERQVKVRWNSRTRTLVLPMVCTLSTLFYHLQKRQQAHRPRRRGLVGPLMCSMPIADPTNPYLVFLYCSRAPLVAL